MKLVARWTCFGLCWGGAASIAGGATDFSYEYDSQGRLIRARYGSQASILYSYDPAGNPTLIQVIGSGSSSIVLQSLAPGGAVAGRTGITLKVSGEGFPPDALVQWNGASRSTTVDSERLLTAVIPSSDLASAGTASVTVISQQLGGTVSNPLSFAISRPEDCYLASLRLSSSRVQGGTAVEGTLTLSRAAPAGGSTISLTSSRPEAAVPAQVTIAEGNTTAPFSIASTAVSTPTAVVLTGAYSGPTRSANLVLTPQGSSGEASAIFVPIILSSAGANNSFYTSELTLTNRGTGTATLDLTYQAAFGGGGGGGSDLLAPGEQRIYPDALSYLESIGIPVPDLGNRGGTLAVRFQGLASPLEAALTTRTTTAVPNGRAGLAVPGIPASSGLTGASYIFGLRQDARDRSNLAVQNMGGPNDGAITLRVTVYSGDTLSPLSQALPDIMLMPGGFSQISGILNVIQPPLANGYARIERISGSAPYYAYGVINDNQNSDGSFVPPLLENALSGKSALSVPVMVETAAFLSELVLANWSNSSKRLSLDYVASGITTPESTAKLILTLKPGEQSIIPSFVQHLRDQGVPGVGPGGGTFAGALFGLTEEGDLQGIAVGARTSAAGDLGRYGLFYTAVPRGSAFTSSAWVYGLQQNAESRSNLAIVNTGEVNNQASQFTLEIFDGRTGQKVRTIENVSIPARGWYQIGTILAPAGIPQGYVRVTRVSGNNPFLVYGVINDGAGPGQRTGDGAFVPGTQ